MIPARRLSVRCVVFHHISDSETVFTRGLNVGISQRRFERALAFFKKHYSPVSFDDILMAGRRGLPKRPLLITFDDAYASVAEVGVPLCRKHGFPSVFFVNAGFLDNRRLALPNLVCAVANARGMEPIRSAARLAARNNGVPRIETLRDLSGRFLAQAPLDVRQVFAQALMRLADIDENRVAQAESLYLSSEQLRAMASAADVEIGSHTFSHVHCRSLSETGLEAEIDRNRAELEAISGRRVRAFSVPYGSHRDLTGPLVRHLERAGYEAIFLSENSRGTRGEIEGCLDRITTHGGREFRIFCDLEVMPRLRSMRNGLLRGAAIWTATGAGVN